MASNKPSRKTQPTFTYGFPLFAPGLLPRPPQGLPERGEEARDLSRRRGADGGGLLPGGGGLRGGAVALDGQVAVQLHPPEGRGHVQDVVGHHEFPAALGHLTK